LHFALRLRDQRSADRSNHFASIEQRPKTIDPEDLNIAHRP